MPEIFKPAAKHGCVIERTPPYYPELQPIEYVWGHMKNAYRARYDDAGGVKGFLESFFGAMLEAGLLSVVRHCDDAARRPAQRPR